MSLYNDYRPRTFDEVFGQETAVTTLKSIIAKTHEERPRVFLMCGTSGVGKTTLVRIFANSIGVDPNKLDFRDINASSDRSIDSIRDKISHMCEAPTYRQSQGRVWLFDEAHQLLKPSQEALLKICEDVPKFTYIFFATTEPESLGKALRSRCQVINLNTMTPKAIYQTLINVCGRMGGQLDDAAFQKIAQRAEGNMRYAMQLYENYILNGHNVEEALRLGGSVTDKIADDTIVVCRAVISKSAKWGELTAFLNKYRGDHEAVRRAVLGYLGACLLKSNSAAEQARITALMECFVEPLFHAGFNGLVYQFSLATLLK